MSQHTDWMARRAEAQRKAHEARRAARELAIGLLALSSLLILAFVLAMGSKP